MPKPPPIEALPRTNHEIVNFKIGKIANDSLESTKTMIKLCEDAKECGITTLVTLDDQGEKLDNIEAGLTTVKKDMKEAKEQLKGLENSIFWTAFCECCGICQLPCVKMSERSFSDEISMPNYTTDSKEKPVNLVQLKSTSGSQIPGSYGGYIAKITNDAQEEEMSKNMEQISSTIGNLKNMAVDIHVELLNQDQQLNAIQNNTDASLLELKESGIKAGKLINK